jgi:hypothetical protein
LHVGILCRPDAKWEVTLALELENVPFKEENWIVRASPRVLSVTAAPSAVERVACVVRAVFVVAETLLI